MIKLHVVMDTHLCFLCIKHLCLRKMKNDIGCNSGLDKNLTKSGREEHRRREIMHFVLLAS